MTPRARPGLVENLLPSERRLYRYGERAPLASVAAVGGPLLGGAVVFFGYWYASGVFEPLSLLLFPVAMLGAAIGGRDRYLEVDSVRRTVSIYRTWFRRKRLVRAVPFDQILRVRLDSETHRSSDGGSHTTSTVVLELRSGEVVRAIPGNEYGADTIGELIARSRARS